MRIKALDEKVGFCMGNLMLNVLRKLDMACVLFRTFKFEYRINLIAVSGRI